MIDKTSSTMTRAPAAKLAPAARQAPAAKLTQSCPVDLWVLSLAGLLLLFGFVMVASASLEIAMRDYADPFRVIKRHAIYLTLALAVGGIAMSVPIRIWQRLAPFFLLLAFALLALVLAPGLGRTVNGATRWIPIGSFSLQGSEFVKLFVAIYIAAYMVRHKEAVRTSFLAFAKPLLVLAAIVLLLLGQPDLGTSIVIVAAAMGVIFLAGAPWRFFLPLLGLFVTAVTLLATLQPYRLARLIAFMDPWEHQFDSGYQLTQALIAFGRGEWFGLGLGNSIQKLFFLPEAHTDFLFSIIAEETGVAGALLVIALFTWLVLRALSIGMAAKGKALDFHAYLAYAIALLLGIQALVNLGVNLGLLPTKGLTLPFMSYGGNSLMVSCMMVGIVLRIEAETRESRSVSAQKSVQKKVQEGRQKSRQKSVQKSDQKKRRRANG